MNSKTIFLVEDNPSDIDLTKRAFEKNRIGNELIIAEDGQEAIDYLFNTCKESKTLPILILLDLKLPKIDGIEVLRRIRSDCRTKRIPIVVLTSSNEEQDIAACYDNGVNSYIRKPVDFKQFSEAIRALGMYWLILNEPPPKI
ncbi:MAG: response regulator [Desulfobacterales bacterium]|nr:response regulator [Desulfobacterales bacterium]MBF0396365.1 response regulator [Desulfobacterales bacterium]